jgi:hypothetical protein
MSLFDCPVCFHPAFSAVMSTTCGHSLCEECSEKLDTCPICKRENITYVPNFALRHLVAEKYPEEFKKQSPPETFQSLLGKLISTHQILIRAGNCYERFGLNVLRVIQRWSSETSVDQMIQELPPDTQFLLVAKKDTVTYRFIGFDNVSYLLIFMPPDREFYFFNVGFGASTRKWKIDYNLLTPSP